MFREYEGTIDSQGHIEIPRELSERHGLKAGARVKIKESETELVISPTTIEDITDLAGIMTHGDPVAELLKERALDKQREDDKLRF